MQLQGEQDVGLKSNWKVGGSTEEIPDPEPGQAAECHFEGACPVDAERIGIVLPPRIPLRHQFSCVDPVASQAPSFSERHQMLVPVQFPDDFVIADFPFIYKIYFYPGLQRAVLCMNWIKVPIDVRPVVESLVPEQVKLMPTNVVRLVDDAF